ncbi:MAG: hypothetical protein HN341_11300 [Verrucomicrobia bacterium]|nr:hypothetical protein [Verrucomicrobiota bacterium]
MQKVGLSSRVRDWRVKRVSGARVASAAQQERRLTNKASDQGIAVPLRPRDERRIVAFLLCGYSPRVWSDVLPAATGSPLG